MNWTLNETINAAVKRWRAPWRNGGTDERAHAANFNYSYRPGRFTDLSLYKSIKKHQTIGKMLSLEDPFFRVQEAHLGTSTRIAGNQYLNFATCDYLGLSQHPSVVDAAKSALAEYGTCVSASRMVAGELPLHQVLETEIAEFCGLESALAFVSGHAANVSTISTVMGEEDLIVLDEFVHNSAVVGARLSRATCLNFPHNNLVALDRILAEHRATHRNALVVVEGCYSTEGDIPDLHRLVEIKERYGAWLMVDDAHALGVLGASGRGVAEHFDIAPAKIDILMGTLSKTLASCGGFIAGQKSLIEVLRYAAPGFVFSVGLPPAMAAAALASLRVMRQEPERVGRLQSNAALFLEEARAAGMDTGKSEGGAIVPVMVGSMQRAARLTQRLFIDGINASPIIYPGVPINAARLRFFLTSEHTPEQVQTTARITQRELARC
jgi:8-amino-7-oxononanoate synthase